MHATDRRLGTLGAVAGFLAVAAGAFGAHALKDRLPTDALALFETAVRWHALHAVVVLAVSLAARPSRAASAAGWAFLAGIVLFCGSLYALAAGAPRALGAITPVGGVAWLVGWGLLAASFARSSPAGVPPAAR